MSKTQSYYCMPQRSNLINLNDISKFKTNSKLYMRERASFTTALGSFLLQPLHTTIPFINSFLTTYIRLLHSLHAIRGFLAGVLLNIIHEKVTSNSSKKDTLNLFLNARAWNIFILLFTSWISSDNFSSCVWISLLSVGKTVCLLFIGGSMISISCSSSPSILICSWCSSTNLFGTANTLWDPIFQKAVPYEKLILK